MSLTPSERIKIISEISNRLGTQSYSLVDLTLKQFSLPSTDLWSGTTEDYIVEMIQNAPDQSLIDLAEHLGYRFDTNGTPRIDPIFWRKDMLRLFVSHLSTHRAFAGELQEALLPFGISAFVAHNDIEPTLEWQHQIELALSTCEALVALMHEGFQSSKWADQEIGFAMGRAVPVFAVRLGQDPYGFIGRFQAFNGNGKSAEVLASEIFDGYRRNKQSQRRMMEVLLGLFEQSGSFAEAKTRIGYLESLESWDQSFSARLRTAVLGNSQISNAWSVPERAETLIKKWASTGK